MADFTLRRFPSPLRYPGGKGKLANYLKMLFLENRYSDFQYIEPFAGGASVALTLLYEGYASHIHINDLNRGVHAFWRVVLDDPDALCARIRRTKVTMWQWRRQRAVQLDADADTLDLAFSTFFLNRTNRSGIIAGGVIGGAAQDGAWAMDARYNVEALTKRIEKVARHAPNITLTNIDAARYLDTVLPTLPLRSFVYLDPPYFAKGQGLYQNAYGPGDHSAIATRVARIRQRWLVSYDAQPEILALYRHHHRLLYDLSYSAADRYRGSEVMFFGPSVSPPDVARPSGLSQKQVDSLQRATFVRSA